MNWRKAAEKQKWSEIVAFKLSDSELEDLEEILCKFVPVKEYGDGVIKFKGYIKSRDTKSREISDAAFLLECVHREYRYRDKSRPEITHTFEVEIDLIHSIFRDGGFPNGRPEFVYWSYKFQKFRGISFDLVRSLESRFWEFQDNLHGKNLPYMEHFHCDVIEKNRRPWRYSMSTAKYCDLHLEINSLVWCAEALHQSVEMARQHIAELSKSRIKRLDRRFIAHELADSSIQIGILSEQIGWKLKHEKAALETYVRKEKSSAGSAKRNRNNRNARIKSLLMQMERLVAENPDFRRVKPDVVGLVALKDAKAANPKLWQQGQGQLAEYLTDLASTAEFKERFQALFYG